MPRFLTSAASEKKERNIYKYLMQFKKESIIIKILKKKKNS